MKAAGAHHGITKGQVSRRLRGATPPPNPYRMQLTVTCFSCGRGDQGKGKVLRLHVSPASETSEEW